jgi:hypothetical protein
MTHMILPVLFVVGILALGVWSMLSLARTSAEVYKNLDAFKAEAEATDDYKILCDINTRLIAYARKNCYLRAYGEAALKVNIYVHTKAELIRKFSSHK